MRKKSSRKLQRKRVVRLKKRVNSILVPIDGSSNSFRALDFAISVAKSLEAEITVVSVIDLPPTLEYSVLDPVSKRLQSQYRSFSQKAKNKVTKKRIKFASKIIHGNTGNSIIKFSKSGKYDIIIMGSRGIGGFSGLLVGSVANHIIQKSKIPVMIIK